MLIEVCLICSGLHAGSELIKKIRNSYFQKPIQEETTVIREKLSSDSYELHNQIKQIVDRETVSGDTASEKFSEKSTNQVIAVSSVSLGFIAMGTFYPPLKLLSVPGIVYGGFPFFRRSWELLKQGKVNVDIIVALTIGGCLVFGYFFIGSLAILVNALSEKLLAKITQDSRGNLIDIFGQAPTYVWVLSDGAEVRIPFEELKAGDIAVINAGEIIPADGTITDGMSSIDQHILTGEATPSEKKLGDQVFALTTVLSGRVCMEVEKSGEETTAAKIGHILNNTVDFKSTVQLKSKHLADKTVAPTLIFSAVSLPIIGPMGALAVINSHFKDKLSVIVPISTLNYFRIASENAILIKDGRSLELLDQVDTIVFDKTGTLTEEQPTVGKIHICSHYKENDILKYAAAAECNQTHPVARAITEEAQKRKLSLPATDETEYKIGYGLTVKSDGYYIHVGSHRFMEMTDIDMPRDIGKIQEFCHIQGYSLVMIAADKQLIGAIELIPTVRPEMKKVIQKLRKRKKINTMYIISGDHEAPTQKLADELGIDHYFAETLPAEKADIIERLKNEGKFICYIGDGINDSIALKKSHVSVSLRGASTVATDTAQIILMDEGLSHLDLLFDISQKYGKNTNISYAIVMAQTSLGIGGVLLLGFGLPYTISLNLIALMAGTVNSMLPLLTYSDKK